VTVDELQTVVALALPSQSVIQYEHWEEVI